MNLVELRSPRIAIRGNTHAKVKPNDLVQRRDDYRFYLVVDVTPIDKPVHPVNLKLKIIPHETIENEYGFIANYPEQATGNIVMWWLKGERAIKRWGHRDMIDEIMREEFTREFMQRAEKVFG